jgi:hypothetical protein
VSVPGGRLSAKKEQGREPRAVLRLYGAESIEAMNQIAEALNKRPSRILQEWIATTHAELVDNGQIDPTQMEPE